MKEDLVLTLINTFDKSSLSELDFTDGTYRLVLRKAAAAQAAPAFPAAAPPSGREAVHLGLPALSSSAAAEKTDGEFITSPIVGTFYPAPGPDAPPFVRPGSKVKAGDPLCILEAMKMMNRLEAEFDCEIVAVKAGGGELVEFGQELFEVRRL